MPEMRQEYLFLHDELFFKKQICREADIDDF